MPGIAFEQQIAVVLVDRNALFRAGLRQLLEGEGIEVLGEESDPELALTLVEACQPDVAIVDPGPTGAAAAQAIGRLKGTAPATHVLVLAAPSADHDAVEVVRMGASCYVLKDAPVETILAGVRAAAAGQALISPRFAAALVRRLRGEPRSDGPPAAAVLSEREQEVLRLIAVGKENDEIAAELYISPHTVKNHISSILGKLEVTNRVQAAVRAVREAMV